MVQQQEEAVRWPVNVLIQTFADGLYMTYGTGDGQLVLKQFGARSACVVGTKSYIFVSRIFVVFAVSLVRTPFDVERSCRYQRTGALRYHRR
jgi:hypothetical protein